MSKIETREEALKAVKESSYVFFFFAAVQVPLGYFFGMLAWLDGALYLVLATFLLKFSSRIAAVLLLTETSINLLQKLVDGNSPLSMLFVLLVSFRGVQATYRFHKLGEASASDSVKVSNDARSSAFSGIRAKVHTLSDVGTFHNIL